MAALVDEYGEEVLADPGTGGFNVTLWVVPILVAFAAARRDLLRRPHVAGPRPDRRARAPAAAERRGRAPPGRGAEPMTGGVDTTIIAAFAVGFISFISPCVLPLVPGYLSAVSGYSLADMKSGERGLAKILLPAIVFCLSFTAVFVALGMTATGLGSTLQDAQRHAGQDRRRRDHRARRLLPAHAVRAAPEQGMAAGRAHLARRQRRPADRRRRVRGGLDAVHRPDAGLDPERRRHAGHGRQGRHPARVLLARARGAVPAHRGRVHARHRRVPGGCATTT